MNAPIRRMLPVGIVPGLHLEFGHHQTAPHDFGCNKKRRINLYHPNRVRLTPARRIPLVEWEAGR